MRFRITILKSLQTREDGYQTWESTMEISARNLLEAIEEGEEQAKQLDGEVTCVRVLAE